MIVMVRRRLGAGSAEREIIMLTVTRNGGEAGEWEKIYGGEYE